MTKAKLLPVKSDLLFRLFFADERNKDSLIAFLKAILILPNDDYDVLEITDPHLLREYEGDKLAVIDVKLRTKNNKVIHIEFQLKVAPELTKRILYYNAKLITEQMGSGDEYTTINRVISIMITDEDYIKGSPDYHHCFRYYDPITGIELTDISEIHTLELSKLPNITDGTDLYSWAKFIDAESEEEFTMAAEMNPQVARAVVRFRELSADERVRDRYERREQARRDQAMFVNMARQEGRQEGEREKALSIAKNLIRAGMPLDAIVSATGLSREEAEGLRVDNQDF
jgi:predicted transposase/invertase (TIGR01784 family)